MYWRGEDSRLKEEKYIDCPMGWWYYLQIKDLFNSDKRNFGIMKQYTDLDKILVGDRSKIISKLYQYCLKVYTLDESVKIQMVRWVENINRPIMMEEWEFLWNKTWEMMECTRLKENYIKMFYRWYITPEQIVRISKDKFSALCWKCGKEKGTFFIYGGLSHWLKKLRYDFL